MLISYMIYLVNEGDDENCFRALLPIALPVEAAVELGLTCAPSPASYRHRK